MRRLLSWMLVPLLAACIDFVDVTEPPSEARQSALQVYVEVFEGNTYPYGQSTDSVYVRAWLRVGMDSRTQHLRVANDTLWIMGTPLLPDAASDPHVLQYHAVLPRSRVQLNTGATVLPPRVSGVATRPEIRWYAPRMIDSDTLLLRRGDDLHLRTATQGTPDNREERWTLNLSGPAGQVSSFRHGTLPTTISVPSTLIPYGAGGFLHATVSHNASWGDNPTGLAANTSYLVEIDVQTRMHWIVRIIDP